MQKFKVKEEKLIKKRLSFFNVDEKVVPKLSDIVSANESYKPWLPPEPGFEKPTEEQIAIKCNQCLGKLIFNMKKNMRYLSAAGKKSLTMRLSELSVLFRIVFREMFENLEVYPHYDEVLSNSLLV